MSAGLMSGPDLGEKHMTRVLVDGVPYGYYFDLFPIDRIEIGSYQRALNSPKVADILKAGFNWMKFGVVELSRRDGKYYVYDGQHRIAAARRVGISKVPAQIWTGMTEADEAASFVGINSHRGPVKSVDKWRAQLVAKDPKAQAVAEILAKYHIRVARGRRARERYVVTAVGNIMNIYEQRGGDKVLDEVLGILTEAYMGEPDSLGANMIYGLSMFTRKYAGAYSRARLVRALSQVPVQAILRQAKAYIMIHGHMATAISVVVAQLYNKGLPREKRLPISEE